MPSRIPSFLRQCGPGVVTGAADDDPSGIATYTQAGAQFGTGVLWTVFLTLPFMVAVQLVSARIGRQSGHGLAANLARTMPRPLLLALVALLLAANTVNIAADLAAMGEAVTLVAGGSRHLWAAGFGIGTVLLQVLVPYRRLARVLKWLTLSLFVYVGVAFTVRIPWADVLRDLVLPRVQPSRAFWLTIVAVLGTTISPYLFFWQASQEVEELQQHHVSTRRETLASVRRAIERMRLDTITGMVFSNGIAFFVMLSAAVVLHGAGVDRIDSAAQAAAALKPVAGELAFALFAAGIVATGLLAVPVLASSAAYAVAEAMGWSEGLEHRWREARGFYGVIAIATLAGIAIGLTPIQPIQALVWSAVVNGIVAVPVMLAMMLVGNRADVMGRVPLAGPTRWLGWGAVALMAAAVALMGWDMVAPGA